MDTRISEATNAIALNGRFSGTLQPTGTQRAAYNLFDAIIRHPRRDIPVVAFADPGFPGVAAWNNIEGVRLCPVPFSRWSRGRAQVWEQLIFPRRCRRIGVRIAHHPMTTSPALNLGVRSIVTLHDLNFALRPEWYSRRFRAVYRVTALPGLRSADMVVTISDYVQGEAVRCLRLRPERTYRVYNGTNELGSGSTPQPRNTGSRYILSVGSLQPHKNLKRIVDAFLLVSEACPDLELWVVGRKQPRFRDDNEEENLLRHPKIKSLGYLSDAELHETYVNAAAFCYPSIEEGFGLPILEAMQAGVPVVTSDKSCLPEIAGGAAELADPFSVASIADALKRVLSLSPSERDRVVATGTARAKQFSWDTSAEAYLQLYRKLLDA